MAKTSPKKEKVERKTPKGLSFEEMKNEKPVGNTVGSYTTLNQALFAFQGECPVIPRNGTGKINDREYKYATLDDVITFTKPALQKTGLMIVQPMNDNNLITELVHVASGEKVTSTLPLGNPGSSQDLGARITYLRRYQISSILGLSIEQDTDAKPPVVESTVNSTVKSKDEQAEAYKKSKVSNPENSDEEHVSMDGAVMSTGDEPAQKKERSDGFLQAEKAILQCKSKDAIDILEGKLKTSLNFSQNEKVDLMEILVNHVKSLS